MEVPVPLYCIGSDHLYEWDNVDVRVGLNFPVIYAPKPGTYQAKFQVQGMCRIGMGRLARSSGAFLFQFVVCQYNTVVRPAVQIIGF